MRKGHAGGIVYAALAEKGFFLKKLELTVKMDQLYQVIFIIMPGVDFSSGSLVMVHLLVGISFSDKNKKILTNSDGELDEGSNWEAILFALLIVVKFSQYN